MGSIWPRIGGDAWGGRYGRVVGTWSPRVPASAVEPEAAGGRWQTWKTSLAERGGFIQHIEATATCVAGPACI